ncbi:unnamed protein product [Parascedosporium putredinis]|uniref:Uncharacterized protein n=1 Tax=Parascedosporium putredinis TaxID=1442378 RepID=A0A9P1H958_9PEZI|nr:unnamed protein product [Parascedosporium putredinis]CAI8001374.1 unnamed protein product [Parascedosporium putredinis]
MAIAKVHPRLKAQTATQVPRMVVPHLCRPFHNIPIYLPGPPVMQLRDYPRDYGRSQPLLTTITVARLGTTLTTHRGAPTRASMLALLTLGMVTHPTRKAPASTGLAAPTGSSATAYFNRVSIRCSGYQNAPGAAFVHVSAVPGGIAPGTPLYGAYGQPLAQGPGGPPPSHGSQAPPGPPQGPASHGAPTPRRLCRTSRLITLNPSVLQQMSILLTPSRTPPPQAGGAGGVSRRRDTSDDCPLAATMMRPGAARPSLVVAAHEASITLLKDLYPLLRAALLAHTRPQSQPARRLPNAPRNLPLCSVMSVKNILGDSPARDMDRNMLGRLNRPGR